MWGYPRIERTVPAGARRQSGALTAHQKERRRIRQALAGAGFYEAWTTTFLAPGDLARAGLPTEAVEVENPLDQSESILRTSLRPGLLKALRFNVDRQMDDLAFFEIGRVFAPPTGAGPTPDEEERLGIVVLPARSSSRPVDDHGAVEAAVRTWTWLRDVLRLDGAELRTAEIPGLHATRAAHIATGSAVIGEVGEIGPGVADAYGVPGRIGWVSLSLDLVAAQARRPLLARDVSRFPASDLDLAFVVEDSVPAGELANTLRDAGGEVVEDLTLFDVYRGERLGQGRRSLAFRVRFRALDRTLGDTELGDLRQRLIEAATAAGAELRT